MILNFHLHSLPELLSIIFQKLTLIIHAYPKNQKIHFSGIMDILVDLENLKSLASSLKLLLRLKLQRCHSFLYLILGNEYFLYIYIYLRLPFKIIINSFISDIISFLSSRFTTLSVLRVFRKKLLKELIEASAYLHYLRLDINF